MRFNRFVFLNLPMLSLETHLGVIASPQAPFPADYVTLPVSASHRRFGSLLLTAEEGHVCKKNGHAFQHAQVTKFH
jgi:hypothetical protein